MEPLHVGGGAVRGEVINRDQGVLGREQQRLQRVAGAGPRTGEMSRVQTGAEVLGGERDQCRLAGPGRSDQVLPEVGGPHDRAVDASKQRYIDLCRCNVEERQARSNGLDPILSVRRIGECVALQRWRQPHVFSGNRPNRPTSVEVGIAVGSERQPVWVYTRRSMMSSLTTRIATWA
jgi:hypothetical protein